MIKQKTRSQSLLFVLALILVIFVIIVLFRLIEDAAQENADEVLPPAGGSLWPQAAVVAVAIIAEKIFFYLQIRKACGLF